jgi:hypothetical protein
MKTAFASCLVLASAVGIFFFLSSQVSSTQHKDIIIGRVENVAIDAANLILKARIDTGAGVTSVSAKIINLQKNTANGKPDVVTFQVLGSDGKTKILKREVVEWMSIKKRDSTGFVTRPVVELALCLGGKHIKGLVNLSDRKNFIYPILIGRNLLKSGGFLINPRRKFTHKPGCI